MTMPHAPFLLCRLPAQWARLLMMVVLASSLMGCDTSASPPAGADEESSPITLTHAAGETILAAPAVRVVALEWTYAEDLLAVGVQPVGVADVEGFKTWVTLPVQLGAEVADVGTRQEPSLEHITALAPDLIVGTALRHEPIYSTLSAIAPTLLFDEYHHPDGELAAMRATFETIASATGRTDEASQVLADLDNTIANTRQRVEAMPEADRAFVLVQMVGRPQSPMFRVFADNALSVRVLEQAGLTNAWSVAHEPHGFSTVGLEPLTDLAPVHFMHVTQPGQMSGLHDSHALWSQMAFVKANRVHDLGGGTWLFGGPLSCGLLIERARSAILPNINEPIVPAGAARE